VNLNDADVKLATTYQIILHALPMGGRDAEKDKQFQWLKQRNSCGANNSCIKPLIYKANNLINYYKIVC
jgi:uncharacterized protein